MNRQARVVGVEEWSDYGKVTLFEAGRQEAKRHASMHIGCKDYMNIDVETRDADDSIIPASVNTYRVTFHVEVLDARKGCEDE